MRILVVDDSEPKQGRVRSAILEAVGVANADIRVARNCFEAAELLEAFHFDLMILDLNLPIRANEHPKADGGIRLLRQLVRGGPRFRRPVHICGLTAYDNLVDTFDSEFQAEGWQLIQFDASSVAWSDTLQNKVRHIAESATSSVSTEYSYDLAIITALKTVELEAVLQLDGQWTSLERRGDSTQYHSGIWTRGEKCGRVVAAAAIEMGMPAAASLATKMIIAFKPRYLAMAGIAAGIGLNYGDIIIADQSWDYGSGKLKQGLEGESDSIFSPAPNYIPIDPTLKEQAETFISSRRDRIAAIQASWQGNPVHSVLKAVVGPMASGAAVIEHEGKVEEIRQHNRKVIGVEMETYGVYLAARIAPEPRPFVFSVKSVCDFGVPPKTDEYQRYAAFTSARFIYELVLEQLIR
jgi:nucleoside phosphorylase